MHWLFTLSCVACGAAGLAGPARRRGSNLGGGGAAATSAVRRCGGLAAGPGGDFGERIESAKTGVVGALAASLAAAPVGFVVGGGGVPQWEFDVDQLSLMGFLFGLVYRYAVREDESPELRMGVVAAFALTRGVGLVRVSPGCDAIPLSCGAPLGYLDWAMLDQLASGVAVSTVAFGAAAAAVDYGARRGWLARRPP